jgi:hypothetical protein
MPLCSYSVTQRRERSVLPETRIRGPVNLEPSHMNIRAGGLLAAALLAAAPVATAGCSSTRSGQPAASSATAAGHAALPAAAVAPAEAETAAAARAAAVAYFELYAAGQYSTDYQLLTPAARRGPGVGYRVTRLRVTGATAVARVSLRRGAARLGAWEQVFTFSRGRWLLRPADLAVYRRHTAAQVVAALKARGACV